MYAFICFQFINVIQQYIKQINIILNYKLCDFITQNDSIKNISYTVYNYKCNNFWIFSWGMSIFKMRIFTCKSNNTTANMNLFWIKVKK